jgi:hypothetical protein
MDEKKLETQSQEGIQIMEDLNYSLAKLLRSILDKK